MGLEEKILDIIKRSGEEERLTDKRIKQIVIQKGWTAPTLLNSWANFDGGYSPAGYFKDSLGIVHIRGLVKDGTIDQPIFQLPAGYRPAYEEIFMAISYGTAHIVSRCDVCTNGDVVPVIGGNVFFSLDGITFRIA